MKNCSQSVVLNIMCQKFSKGATALYFYFSIDNSASKIYVVRVVELQWASFELRSDGNKQKDRDVAEWNKTK